MPENRTETGQFVKGVSGNPGGRPANLTKVVEAARAHTESAVATLCEIMTGEGPPAARVAAAVALLDRGWGKPSQPLEGSVDGALLVGRIELVPFSGSNGQG